MYSQFEQLNRISATSSQLHVARMMDYYAAPWALVIPANAGIQGTVYYW